MNKKVSTLLTAGLFLSGSLFSSAFAEKLIKGDLVKELNTNEAYIFSNGEMAYGFTKYSQENTAVTQHGLAFTNNEAETNDVDVRAYLWKVTAKTVDSQNSEYVYELTNQLTGLKLQFNQGTGEFEPSYASGVKATSGIVFERANEYYANLFASATDNFDEAPATSYVSADTQEDKSYLVLTADGLDVQTEDELTAAGASAKKFGFYVAKNIPATSEELNDLYNSVGFNFTLGKGYEGVENIFDGEAVKAIYVASDIEVDTDRTFPAGTYFAVSTPAGDYTKLTSDDARRDYLMDCEFIALSATDHMSYDAETLKKGNGYMLTTVSGRDLNKYTKTGDGADASKMSNGETISVWNACFNVFRKPGTQTYGLTIPTARVSVSGSQMTVTGLQLDVYSVYGGAGYLATEASNAVNFIFSFEESNVVKATELLKENAAAIYNIKFKTTGSDQTENNKYLFASAYNNTLYAKGVVLTDENNPEFQFTITNVDANNNITFTNRANHNAKFTAQLFDEGNGVYSLALLEDERGYAATILNVDNEGNVTDKKSNGTVNTAALHRNKIVLETPESTDMFNGTWTVTSNEKVTISFARDNDPTSNKIYPTVEENGSAYSLTGEQTAEISEASQWQLVRTSNKPTYYTQTYAFKVVNGETETVKYMSLGDTIAYYTYNIQLVADGMAQNQFLSKSGTSYSINNGKTAFVIKDNIDGSVSIVTDDDNTLYNGEEFLSISGYESGNNNDLEDYLNDPIMAQSLVETSKATDIKTYLLSEAPEVSWPATEGHISWQGELGNYISMDENRDGIVVNDSEEVYYLNVTDKKEVVPSFYISRGTGADDRMFLFNPQDSIDYYVGEGKYDKTYEWQQGTKKVIFKAAQLNETSDTLTTNIKGEVAKLAMKSDNKGTQGGLNRFKFQIIEAADAEGLYYIRQAKAGIHNGSNINNESNLENYLSSWNEKLTWSNKTDAMLFHIEGVAAPTANEGVSATEVKIIATDGAINVKNAAGKNVVVSTILGQIVANEVLTSDNATISVPAGIVIVSVDGEEAVKVNVK